MSDAPDPEVFTPLLLQASSAMRFRSRNIVDAEQALADPDTLPEERRYHERVLARDRPLLARAVAQNEALLWAIQQAERA